MLIISLVVFKASFTRLIVFCIFDSFCHHSGHENALGRKESPLLRLHHILPSYEGGGGRRAR